MENETMTTITNGQNRKSLASQLDRLDTILDTLGVGLNQAVASAVEQAVEVAVREAIQGVIAEVLTNPDLLALLRTAVTPPASTTPADPTPPDQPRRGPGLKGLLKSG